MENTKNKMVDNAFNTISEWCLTHKCINCGYSGFCVSFAQVHVINRAWEDYLIQNEKGFNDVFGK